MKFFNEGISPLSAVGLVIGTGAGLEGGAQLMRFGLNRTTGQAATRVSHAPITEEDLYVQTEEMDAAVNNNFIRPKKK